MFAPQFDITELATIKNMGNMLLFFVDMVSVWAKGLPKNGI
jgi:hypothetical protein